MQRDNENVEEQPVMNTGNSLFTSPNLNDYPGSSPIFQVQDTGSPLALKQPSPMFGRMTPLLKELDLSLEPSHSNEMTLKVTSHSP